MHESEKPIRLLVSYQRISGTTATPCDRVVEIPAATSPNDLTGTVKSIIQPFRPADPSDNYRGQKPSDITILNLINLDQLLPSGAGKGG